MAQGLMNEAPNETWTHLWRFASLVFLTITTIEVPTQTKSNKTTCFQLEYELDN